MILHRLFAQLGLISAHAKPRRADSNTRTEKDLRKMAAAFMAKLQRLGIPTIPQAVYHPYFGGVDGEWHDCRAAKSAYIDILFKDPVGRTHSIEFTGNDEPYRHAHFIKRHDGIPHTEQPGYILQKDTLDGIMGYLEESKKEIWSKTKNHRQLVTA